MIRVKDIEKSLKFYQEVMGMKLLRESGNPDAGFTLYFLGYGSGSSEGASIEEKRQRRLIREGILEPDTISGKIPLDMDQYTRLFGTARIPTEVYLASSLV